tara:strand:- start:406 stop:855 length:450 start_codon:yes stop_codon:yes gene_type:complete
MTEATQKLLQEKIVPEFITWYNEKHNTSIAMVPDIKSEVYHKLGSTEFADHVQWLFMENTHTFAEKRLGNTLTAVCSLPIGIYDEEEKDVIYCEEEPLFDLWVGEHGCELIYVIVSNSYCMLGPNHIVQEHGCVGHELEQFNYQHRVTS